MTNSKLIRVWSAGVLMLALSAPALQGTSWAGEREDALLLTAVREGKTVTVRDWLRRGANAEVVGTEGWPALMYAAQLGHTDIVKLLLENGANASVKNRGGWTPLMFAAANGRLEIVKLLLEHGADAAVRAADGKTAILVATEKKQPEIVRALQLHLKQIDVAQRKEANNRALADAAGRGDTATVKKLLAEGAVADSRDAAGWPAVVLAAKNGKEETVVALLDAGANINARATEPGGSTALLAAAQGNYPHLVQTLLQRGANAAIRTKNNNATPLAIATQRSFTEVARLLREGGAKE